MSEFIPKELPIDIEISSHIYIKNSYLRQEL